MNSKIDADRNSKCPLANQIVMILIVFLGTSVAWAQIETDTPPPPEAPYPGAPEPGFTTTPTYRPYDEEDPKRKPIRVRDGVHYYEIEASPMTAGASVRGGTFGPLDIVNEKSEAKFEELYGDKPGPLILFDYEKHLGRSVGRFNLRLTTGLYLTQGRGRFTAPDLRGEEAMEKFTFILLPNMATLQYKFQYADAQWVVPYFEGGAGYFTFFETRDDKPDVKLGGAAVGVGAGGLQILMDWLDRRSAANLDRQYGVNHVWLTAEYRAIIGLHDTFDFTSSIINIGFLFEF